MVKEDKTKSLYANNDLINWKKKVEKSAIFETIFGVLIFIFFTFKMYSDSDSNTIWFLVCFIVLLFYLILYTYGGTARRGRVLNNTIETIDIKEHDLKIKTFKYNILGIKHLSAKEIEIPRNKAIMIECDYPIMDKKTINGKAISIIVNKQNKYYILPQFFPKEIKEFLKK